MPHVSIKRLSAGYRQHHIAHRHQCGCLVIEQEFNAVKRVHRCQNGRMFDNIVQTQYRQHRKPDQHDRPESRTNHGRTLSLHVKKAEQYDQRNWNNERFKCWRRDLQPLNSRKHGNRRRHHAITVEHRRAKNADDHDQLHLPRFVLRVLQRQGNQGHDAALAPVVGAHDEHYVFDRNDNDQRPKEEREAAKNIGLSDRNRVIAGKDLFHRIERAGADVAINHAKRSQRHDGQPLTRQFGRTVLPAAH